MAVIRLEGLSLFGHHGANASERAVGTRLVLDVELELDTDEAERSDRLRNTVDYDRIFGFVRDRVEQDSFHLLESLAGDIAHACLVEFEAERVRVRVAKSNLGWPSGGRAIIEVERRRGESRAPVREGSPGRRSGARGKQRGGATAGHRKQSKRNRRRA